MKNNFKWYYKLQGGHVHCRCFVNGANSGQLVFRVEEWEDLLKDWTSYKGAVPVTLIDNTTPQE